MTLIEQGEIVCVSHRIRCCREPKDDKILELAADGNASYIITGDADLLILKSFEGIPISMPKDFLTALAPS